MTGSSQKTVWGLDVATWSFLCGRFVSNLGEQLLLYAIPIMVYEHTGDVAKSGQAFLIEWLPAVLLLPFLGSLTDWVSERRVYLGSELLRAFVCAAALAGISSGLVSHFVALIAAAAALGVLHSQNYVALETTIVRRFGAQNLGQVQSLVEGIESVSEVAGPALAGLLTALITKEWLLAVAASVFVASASSVLALSEQGPATAPGPRKVPKKEPILRGVLHGFVVVSTMPRILALCGISMSLNLLMGVVLATNPAVAKTVLSASDQEFALIGITGGLAGAALMFGLPLLMKKLTPNALAGLAFALLFAAGVLLGLSRNFGLFVAGFACLSCAIGVLNVYVRLERAKAIAPDVFGRAIGVIVLLNRLGMPLAGALVALSSRVLPAQTLVLTVATATLLIVLTIVGCLTRRPRPGLTEPLTGVAS
jgi:MFS family permease